MIIFMIIDIYTHTFVCIPKTNTFFFVFFVVSSTIILQDDGQMQRVQIFQALPVLLLVLLTLASNFAKDGAFGRWESSLSCRCWACWGVSEENDVEESEGRKYFIQELCLICIYIYILCIIYTHVQT